MAHRGNRSRFPENTPAAFRQAIADGADIVETDLHVSSDGAFVCIHDATLERATGLRGAVGDMTLAQLKSLPGGEEGAMPTLAEMAALVPNDVLLAVELKSERFTEYTVCRSMVGELEEAGIRNRTIALSFHRSFLRVLRSVAPDIPLGHITYICPWPHGDTQMLGPFWPLLLLNPLYVLRAHRRGQSVCPLDSHPDSCLWFYRLLGCDAILTDNPEATLRKLGRKPKK